MKIHLETDYIQFIIETTALDFSEGTDALGTTWTLQGSPLNLSGERWDSEDGETAWRSFSTIVSGRRNK